MTTAKRIDGSSDRQKNALTGQLHDGLTSESARALDVDEESVERTRRKLSDDPREKLLEEVREQEDASRLGSE